MLITQLKDDAEILPLIVGNTVILACEGCSEVHFPQEEIKALQQKLFAHNPCDGVNRTVIGVIMTNYVCNDEVLDSLLQKHAPVIEQADTILALSCGVGVQTIAHRLSGKRVLAACDTMRLPGWQGVTPLEYDCVACGECHLNETGGICPVTACSKNLLNGQCGGASSGNCEVDGDMKCGWDRIQKRLEQTGQMSSHRQLTIIRSH